MRRRNLRTQVGQVYPVEFTLLGHELTNARFIRHLPNTATIVTLAVAHGQMPADVILVEDPLVKLRSLLGRATVFLTTMDPYFCPVLFFVLARAILGRRTAVWHYQAHLFTQPTTLKLRIKRPTAWHPRFIVGARSHFSYVNEHVTPCSGGSRIDPSCRISSFSNWTSRVPSRVPAAEVAPYSCWQDSSDHTKGLSLRCKQSSEFFR